MHRPLLFKSIIISLLVLLILIPLEMVRSTIAERVSYREEAIQSILTSHAGTQTLTGPILVIPYKETVSIPMPPVRIENGEQISQTKFQTIEKNLLIFPEVLHMTGTLKPEKRYRGIHEILLYEMDSQLSGTFLLPGREELKLERSDNHIRFEPGTPYFTFNISDPRGLLKTPALTVEGKALPFFQSAKAGNARHPLSGLHAEIDMPEQHKAIEFSLNLAVNGTQSLSVVPVGKDNDIRLLSTWSHPKFGGAFLPRARTINQQGFDATWNVTAFNTNTHSQLQNGIGPTDTITVDLIEPVNTYLQTDRATKYGFLFVLLTFVGFFIFELLKKLRIHPVQYLLVGLGLVIFFLLLLALSEHIPFIFAYLAASSACIGLLGFYLTYVLRSPLRGIAFAALLTSLYGALYGILLSEDNALALGACLLFLILAIIMILTRHIDWYAISTEWQSAESHHKR